MSPNRGSYHPESAPITANTPIITTYPASASTTSPLKPTPVIPDTIAAFAAVRRSGSALDVCARAPMTASTPSGIAARYGT